LTWVAEKKYDDIKTLVAFSGTVDDPDFKGRSYSEQGMNGFGERELPERFETEEYQVLIVAEKYQTGFDQPLLHTMYVDKRLDGGASNPSRFGATPTPPIHARDGILIKC